MFIRVVAKKHNVLFECDRVVEVASKITFFLDDEIHTELIYDDHENMDIYAMNDKGKTIQHWGIFSEGRPPIQKEAEYPEE